MRLGSLVQQVLPVKSRLCWDRSREDSQADGDHSDLVANEIRDAVTPSGGSRFALSHASRSHHHDESETSAADILEVLAPVPRMICAGHGYCYAAIHFSPTAGN